MNATNLYRASALMLCMFVAVQIPRSLGAAAQLSDLKRFEQELRDYVQKVSRAVVQVEYCTYETADRGELTAVIRRHVRHTTAGLLRTAEGSIVTLAHQAMPPSIPGLETRIEVTLFDGRVVPAQRVAGDPDTGIMLLELAKIEDQLPAIVRSREGAVRAGDLVVAIGADRSNASVGVLSEARARAWFGTYQYPRALRANVAVTHRDVGGLLADSDGRVIGMLACVPSEVPDPGAVGTRQLRDSQSASIPIDLLDHVCEQLLAHGQVLRGSIGVAFIFLERESMQQLGLGNVGALVHSFMPGAGAQASGLKVGDVITSVNRRHLKTFEDLYWFRELVEYGEPGSTLRLEYFRSSPKRFDAVELKVVPRQPLTHLETPKRAPAPGEVPRGVHPEPADGTPTPPSGQSDGDSQPERHPSEK